MSSVAAAFCTLLLYLILVVISVWAVSRLIRPLRPRTAAALALLPLTLTGPAMITGRVMAPLDHHYTFVPQSSLQEELGVNGMERVLGRYDVAMQIVPWRAAVRRALASGHWPVYNPYLLCGDILEAAAQPAAYHPIHLLSYLLPFGLDLSFSAAAVLFASGLCGFCYCREIVRRDLSALLGAAAWMLCDFMLGWFGWPLRLTVVFFPLLLLAVRRVARAPSRRSVAVLTAAFVLILLGGHPESAFHCVVLAAVYGVAELVATRGRCLGPAVAASLLSGVLALALCAVTLLPFVEALPQTMQYTRRSNAESRPSVPWPLALERARAAFVPYAYGVPWSEWIRVTQFTPLRSGYAGSILFAPALFALLYSRWRGRWLMGGLAAGGILCWIAAPGLIDLLDTLPLFDVTNNRRLAFAGGFAFCVLAAVGADTWADQVRQRRFALISLGVLVLHATLIALLWPGFEAAGLSAAFLAERTLIELVPMALAAMLLLSTPYRKYGVLSTHSAKVGLLGLLVLLVGQRMAQMAPIERSFPRSCLRPEIAELAALDQDGEPYRVTGLHLGLRPNISALYGLEDVRGYTAMNNLRLFSTFDLWSSSRAPYAHCAEISDLSRPFLSFLNVRYAFVKTYGRYRPPAHWREVVQGHGFAVIENLRCLPRAFVPARVHLDLPRFRVNKTMAAAKDFTRQVWIQHLDTTSRKPQHLSNGPGKVVSRRHPLGLDLEVELEQDGWVVVSQTAWKGWRATSNGVGLPLHLANKAFLAFQLPAGHHQVALRYQPRSFVFGRAISLGTAAGLLLAGIWLRWRRRQGDQGQIVNGRKVNVGVSAR